MRVMTGPFCMQDGKDGCSGQTDSLWCLLSSNGGVDVNLTFKDYPCEMRRQQTGILTHSTREYGV